MADIVKITKDIEIDNGEVIKKGEVHEVWMDRDNILSIIYKPGVIIDLEPDEYERI